MAGVATWLLRAVDPDTGLVVTDPNVGLLKAGQSGQVSYTILANPR